MRPPASPSSIRGERRDAQLPADGTTARSTRPRVTEFSGVPADNRSFPGAKVARFDACVVTGACAVARQGVDERCTRQSGDIGGAALSHSPELMPFHRRCDAHFLAELVVRLILCRESRFLDLQGQLRHGAYLLIPMVLEALMNCGRGLEACTAYSLLEIVRRPGGRSC